MVRLRSRLSLKPIGEKQLLLQSNPGRRAMFGAVALVLLIAFLVSVDFQVDFEREMIAGSVFYFALVALCLVVAGWNNAVLFDTAQRQVFFIKRMFGARVHSRALPSDGIRSITLQGVRLLKESERPRAGVLGSRFSAHVARRNTYYKLYIDSGDEREFLEDSTDPGELNAAGMTIAGFLGVDFRTEDI